MTLVFAFGFFCSRARECGPALFLDSLTVAARRSSNTSAGLRRLANLLLQTVRTLRSAELNYSC